MTDTDVVLLSDAEIALLTDDELDDYLAYLEDLDAQPDRGPWELQPRQRRAEDALANLEVDRFHELLYGGAAGGGKSDWLLWHQYHLALEHPGFSGLILRRTFPELRRSLIKRSLIRFDHSVAKYRRAEKVWEFRNGSTIEFGYCEADDDVYQYQSAEYDCVAFDELTQWPSDVPYTYLMSRLRSDWRKAARGLVPHIIAGTNPGGVGGHWVKERFVDIAPAETRTEHVDDELGTVTTRVFIPALLNDNRYVNKDAYVAALGNLATETREALLNGSWDQVEGQYFTQWNRAVHVIAPFTIPSWWARARGYDYGYTNPACCLWAAFDEDGTAYVYREWYATGHTPPAQARAIEALNGPHEKIGYTVADPSIWTRTGAGPPIATQLADHGLVTRKANNARVDGWARVRSYLELDARQADDEHPAGKPKLYVFSNCLNLIRTLPMLVRDRSNPEDLDTDGEDHAADALRYLLMSRPPLSRRPKREPSTIEERIAAKHREKRRRERDHPILGRNW